MLATMPRPRTATVRIVMTERLAEHLATVVERGCLCSHSCSECSAIAKAVVLREDHNPLR